MNLRHVLLVRVLRAEEGAQQGGKEEQKQNNGAQHGGLALHEPAKNGMLFHAADLRSVIFHTGIHKSVEQIHQRIDNDKRGCKQQHRALDDRIITVADAIHHETPQSGDGEHRFHQRGACQQAAKAQADSGENRNQRIFQRVRHDNFKPRYAAGLGSADIILVDGIQHG